MNRPIVFISLGTSHRNSRTDRICKNRGTDHLPPAAELHGHRVRDRWTILQSIFVS